MPSQGVIERLYEPNMDCQCSQTILFGYLCKVVVGINGCVMLRNKRILYWSL